MIIGYGRTSTIEQVAGLEAQIRDVKAAGAEKLFSENVSSVAPRQQLEAAIEFAREGDTLVVTKIDRLARSVRHLCDIVDRLQAKGVALRILPRRLLAAHRATNSRPFHDFSNPISPRVVRGPTAQKNTHQPQRQSRKQRPGGSQPNLQAAESCSLFLLLCFLISRHSPDSRRL
jgi:hypothetical protein